MLLRSRFQYVNFHHGCDQSNSIKKGLRIKATRDERIIYDFFVRVSPRRISVTLRTGDLHLQPYG